MAAGLGYKEFNTGDVLTAADANGYLASQVVMVFASAAARTSAIASPQEGMISFLKDTNSTEYYSGSAWVAVAGAGGGMTQLGSTTTLSGASTTVSFDATGYNIIQVVVQGMTTTPNTDYPRIDINGSSGIMNTSGVYGSTASGPGNNLYWLGGSYEMKKDGGLNTWLVQIYEPSSTSYYKTVNTTSAGQDFSSNDRSAIYGGQVKTTSAISSIKVTCINAGNTFNGGQIKIYGVK